LIGSHRGRQCANCQHHYTADYPLHLDPSPQVRIGDPADSRYSKIVTSEYSGNIIPHQNCTEKSLVLLDLRPAKPYWTTNSNLKRVTA
jgi:hypothetical protein